MDYDLEKDDPVSTMVVALVVMTIVVLVVALHSVHLTNHVEELERRLQVIENQT